MQVQTRKRAKNFKFTGKTHSKRGIASLILAVLSCVTGIVAVFNSFTAGGEASVYWGSLGILAMFLAIAAVALASSSRKEEASFQMFPLLGMIVGLLALVSWFVIYMIGSLV
jgi:uncharacterized membrane protein HdeD (DUF308 family)